MVFNIGPEIILTTLIFISFTWLLVLSLYLHKSVSHYKKLTKDTNSKNLQEALESLLANQDLSKEEMKKINLNIDNIKKDASLHIQKVGFVRYNPFENTGGNQSFVIALLNALNNGIIISSLHSRSGPRWYVKWIDDGKGRELDLSKEEEEAIKIAQKAKE
jgi:hypothetical protein